MQVKRSDSGVICDQCCEVVDAVVQCGEEAYYESATVWLCRDCLNKALLALDAAATAPPTPPAPDV